MKVLLVNGSAHKEGCTFTAISEVGAALKAKGVETEIFNIGNGRVRPCIACQQCRKEDERKGKCAFDDDVANKLAQAMQKADGVVIGSPVYFAGPNGALCALLDRVFYMNSAALAFKPAAAVVSCRRGGASVSLDRLHKYFLFARMPVVPSQYWAMVHGNTPDEVKKDEEGLQIMRTLGDNMAWLLEATHKDDAKTPEIMPPIRTNFIR